MGFVTPDLSSVAQKLPQPEQPAIQQAGSTAPQNPPVMLGQPADQPQQQQPQQPQQDPRIEALRQRYIQQATPPPPPTGGPVRQALQGFFKGMEQNMLARVGVPTDLQKQQNALHNLNMLDASQNTMAATRATIAQHTPSVPMMDIEGKPVMGTDGNPILMAPIHAETYYQGLNQQRVLLGVQALKNASINPNLTPDQAAAIGHPELANQPFGKAFGSMLAQQAGKVLITPDMVQKYNMPPEAEGKYAKMSDILSAERLTMTRQTQQWKPDGLGGYIPVTATSTRTFGNNAPSRGAGGGAAPTASFGAPSTGPQSIPGKGPIYAFDPKTNDTVMTTQQEMQQNGYTNPRKVSQKNIEDDRQLNNRLADVATKISRYEDSINTPIDVQDRTFMASLLQTDKFKLGAIGAEIPVDKYNQLIDAIHQSQLSPAAQNRLISYYNARESMLGYQRVLAGSARSSDSQLGLNLGALPGPISPDNFAKEGLRQFKENIPIAGRGLPRMPGIPRAQDILNPPPSIRFTEGADQYNIPADKVPAFKAKHPQAVPSGR